MPTYVATVRDASGVRKQERLQAGSPSEARRSLREQGFYVQDIQESKGLNLEDLASLDVNELLARVSVKDKAIFSRQLAIMINAGVPIVNSLGILATQTTNPKLKKALTSISGQVGQGVSLSQAMGRHPVCFDPLYVSMVQAGEAGGVLDETMSRLSKLLEDMARLQNQIKSALAYPAALTLLSVGVFIGMTVFLIPTFAAIFESIGAELPTLTQVMLNISQFLRTPQYSIGGVVALMIVAIAYQQCYRTRAGREIIDRISLKLPIFGDLIQKSSVARFCRTFGSLSRSGVPVLTALAIVRNTSGNQVIANAVDNVRLEVQRGGMISLALQRERVFPVMVVQMISVGEETGELAQMLMKVADFYEDEVGEAVKALTSLLEPIMIVLLGGMVGTILVSMYLPMFSIFDQLG